MCRCDGQRAAGDVVAEIAGGLAGRAADVGPRARARGQSVVVGFEVGGAPV